MVAAKKSDEEPERHVRKSRPATTPEGRENQMIGLAMEQAEKQIRAGTASSQVLTHFLKLASTREQLEKERIRYQVELDKARMENMASAARVEEMYSAALQAMRTYAGQPPQAPEDDDDSY